MGLSWWNQALVLCFCVLAGLVYDFSNVYSLCFRVVLECIPPS